MIAIQAIFQGARTTADSGWRVTFDTHESQAEQVTEVAKLKDQGLYIVIMTQEEYEAQNG